MSHCAAQVCTTNTALHGALYSELDNIARVQIRSCAESINNSKHQRKTWRYKERYTRNDKLSNAASKVNAIILIWLLDFKQDTATQVPTLKCHGDLFSGSRSAKLNHPPCSSHSNDRHLIVLIVLTVTCRLKNCFSETQPTYFLIYCSKSRIAALTFFFPTAVRPLQLNLCLPQNHSPYRSVFCLLLPSLDTHRLQTIPSTVEPP
jgi:hypothetical protein